MDHLQKMKTGKGFIAALDQSGGSTPKALKLYGIAEDRYSNDEEMFELMHAMRARIITSPAFTGERVLGAILFEKTMDGMIEGKYTADYLWDAKEIVPFLKIDKGLEAEADGVQLMKPIPGLASLLQRANERHVFGTKERSVVKLADTTGIKVIVEQQFELALQVLAAGLVPIIEPEVDIHSPEKAETAPIAWPNPPARAFKLDVGQEVMVLGRVRRRFFRAGGSTQSRTEVVAEEVLTSRQARKVEDLIDRACALIDGSIPAEPDEEDQVIEAR